MLLSVSKEQSLADLLPKILCIKFETVVRKFSGHLGESEYRDWRERDGPLLTLCAGLTENLRSVPLML